MAGEQNNKSFKSHVIHSGTNKAIDSLCELKKKRSLIQFRLQCPAKWCTVYGSAWKTGNVI